SFAVDDPGFKFTTGDRLPHDCRPYPLRRGPGVREGRGDGPVAESGLHQEYVSRALIEAERERVPARVRAVPAADLRLREPALEAPLHLARGKVAAVAASEDRTRTSPCHSG